MEGSGTFKRVLVGTAAGIVPVLVAACTIQLRGDSDNPPARTAALRAPDLLAGKLERCRTVTPEQVADIQERRRAWGENRHRFLAQKKAKTAPSVDLQPSTEPSSALRKDPGLVPGGWPPIATPNGE